MSDQQERASGSDLSVLSRIWEFARHDKGVYVYAILVTPAIAGMSLVQPFLMKKIIDDHIVAQTAEGLYTVGWLYLGAVFGTYLLTMSYTLALSWGGQRTILRLRRHLYRHTLGLGQHFFDRQPAGKLLTRITNDVESLGESLAAGVVTIGLDLLLIFGTVSAMFWLDWKLTLLMLFLAPLVLGTLEWTRRRLKRLFLIVREAIASVNAFMAERIDGVVVVQLFGDEQRTEAHFDERNLRYNRTTKVANVYDAFMYAFVDGISSVFVGLVLFFGAGLLQPVLANIGIPIATEHALSVGLLVAFMDYLDRLFRPLRELSGKITVIQRAIAAMNKIVWLLDADVKLDSGHAELATATRGHIRFSDVHFRYGSDAPDVLRGVDLEVQSGQVLAIVGATGSGKTTITRLIDRSYDGYRGSITLDGVELSTIRLEELRRTVAAVRQDVQVFGQSLQFNVDLDHPDIDEDRRNQAAQLVNANRFVDRLGWTHLLREQGADLSQGEGQLLTFARTMAHDPVVVILDEATASVDTLTESLIQEAIGRILAEKTVIVIAHRLSTIQHADVIAVMERGRVIEYGNHETLLALGGHYAGLVRDGLHGVQGTPNGSDAEKMGGDQHRRSQLE